MLHAKSLGAKPEGMHLDGDGLYLQVTGTARSWVLRYQRDGKRRMMGLGSLADVPLAKARELAKEARTLIAEGADPIDARNKALAEERQAKARAVTFKDAAEEYIRTHRTTWKNAAHREQWPSTLKAYVYPHIGDKAVEAITVVDVRAILSEIWTAIPETASRVRARIETVINAARADDESRWSNPALWERHKHAFPAKEKVRKVAPSPRATLQGRAGVHGPVNQRQPPLDLGPRAAVHGPDVDADLGNHSGEVDRNGPGKRAVDHPAGKDEGRRRAPRTAVGAGGGNPQRTGQGPAVQAGVPRLAPRTAAIEHGDARACAGHAARHHRARFQKLGQGLGRRGDGPRARHL
jgi:Arm DNA-binding domain